MANNNTIPPDAILNPHTPLAFLPPDVADQLQTICYVNVATLAVSLIQWQAAVDLTSYAYRPSRGTGSWRFRRNTILFAKPDLAGRILCTLYRGPYFIIRFAS
jgi:hypothetical protein